MRLRLDFRARQAYDNFLKTDGFEKVNYNEAIAIAKTFCYSTLEKKIEYYNNIAKSVNGDIEYIINKNWRVRPRFAVKIHIDYKDTYYYDFSGNKIFWFDEPTKRDPSLMLKLLLDNLKLFN